MYVADCNNNRVLRFSYPAGGFGLNQPTAEAVFGQADFSGSSSGLTSSTMFQPKEVFALRDTLWVAEYQNNRVTGFFNASTKTSGAAADMVLGQPDFTTNSGGTSAVNMTSPTSVAVDGAGNVYVAEYLNHRVLRFNKASLASGASAAVVFGQPDKITPTSGTGATNLGGPWDILIKNNSLFVAEYDNNRVMRYDDINTATDGYAGSNIFGNTVMGAGSASTTQSSVAGASALAIDVNNRLYVGSWDFNRVMIFSDAFTATNGPNAVNVLGQSNFTSNGFGLTQSTFKNVVSLFVDSPNRHLYAADRGNHRIMQFTASSALPVELTVFTGTARGSSVELSWKTATEVNNYGFEVERSVINNQLSANSPSIGDWAKVGFVRGHGTTYAPQNYSFTDNSIAFGKSSYRLRQIDLDGNFKYTEAIAVKILVPRELALSQNYPNPFNPSTTIEFTVPENGRVTLRVYDVLGRIVATLVQGELEAGTVHSATFDASKISSGIYFFRLEHSAKGGSASGGKDKQLMKKLLVMK